MRTREYDRNLNGAVLDAISAIAEVLRIDERLDEAARLTQDALHLYEQKGNVVSAGRASALLGELQPSPAR